MITASESSFLFRVKSSASRARPTSSGCTHTSRTPASAASWSSPPPAVTGRLTRHHDRGEVRRGRPGQPPGHRLGQLPGLRGDRAPGDHRRVLVAQRADLLVSGQVEGQHRRLPGDHRPQPGQPLVAPTITTRQPASTTVGHDILMRWDTKPVTPSGGCPRPPPLRSLLREAPYLWRDPRSIASMVLAPSGGLRWCRTAAAVKVERPTGRTTLTAARTGTDCSPRRGGMSAFGRCAAPGPASRRWSQGQGQGCGARAPGLISVRAARVGAAAATW
ncbi:hypothetical protein Gobs01_02136 [Geodermatophilus obscurus DSM 43160]|uniref:Uncharacterized protein n=1 Tax=Geodermatophilus obscurus (strain ATCC 25078 / DSM 43160 / JCM 3152 / CCUG 61914 / KCC A-0152 / KCTC 9177 / NBRC 13315 / NRRL B-3577 / G-20) TaxID=526225 RepID=D2SF28_GEOOG|nr:hypothetical protein Gobs_2030 [Geodermatophilus obscurus DSM 43160]